jgi:hypothetical protein
MKIAAPTSTDPVDDTVMDFNYQEVWDRVGCPPLKSVTEGDVLSVRGASYSWVDTAYDFVPIPINFLDTDGAEYCFESYEGITSDFGLAQAYERDAWRTRGTAGRNLTYREESYYTTGDTGYGNGGGVDPVTMYDYSSNSNYCNRGDNRMPTVTTCSGQRTQYDWLGSGRNFPKWYKDAPVTIATVDKSIDPVTNRLRGVSQHRKWFFCGGNGVWNSIRVDGSSERQDYQIRLRPGYRRYNPSDFLRINNRTFKAYARIPGSRALYRQAFTMTVRGTTYLYEYGWPLN